MKTTLHYIIAILLFSLNATHAFAEGEKEPFNITNESVGITHRYNAQKTLLTIGGTGSITITGDGKPVQARIEIKDQSIVNLTIQDLHIQAEVPLTVNNHSLGNPSAVTNIILKGTNILESNAADSQPGMLIDWSTSISGSGSLTVKGSSRGGAGILYGEGYGVYFNPMTIQDNIVVVAIGGKGAEAISGGILNHEGGLLIQGKVDDNGTIEQTSSELVGNLTLGTDFEIPEWATVTIPQGQSITVPKDKTLTNQGTLETEEGGTLTNQGSIINEGTLETENGTLVNEGTIETNGIKTSSKFLNIEGENGFDVSSTSDRATFTYNAENKLLTISGGGGDALLEGIGKNDPVDCGIVITGGSLNLTIKDLNIRADNALIFEDQMPNVNYYPILIGANRLESTSGSGINIHGNTLVIQGLGSLTVIGGDAAYGIQGKVNIYNNACVVAIGGTGGIYPDPDEYTLNNALLISGTKQAEDSITEDYSELKGNITLGGNLEIPEGATVTIPAGQSITVPKDITLTNKGTLTNQGSIVNEGTLETKNGTLVNDGTIKANDIITSSKLLNIGEEDGFNVSTKDDGATFTYDDGKKLLTISGSKAGSVLLKGKNKDNAVYCGIVIKDYPLLDYLTIEDLNITAENAMVLKQLGNRTDFPLTLKGTNRLESTTGPGIKSEISNVSIYGSGSLTVIGEATAFDATILFIKDNACIVAISQNGTSNIIQPSADNLGLFISGIKKADNITHECSQLMGNMTLGTDAEIPEWATVTIADGQTFTIAPNVTLTNKGTITNNGTINNKGTLAGNHPKHLIIFKANDSESTTDVERYITEVETLPIDIFTRSGYTFQGWYTDPTDGTKVETVTNSQALYAQWKADKQPEPPYVPPVPVFYSVYLPQVEGATTDPAPGEYKVESWDNFRFTLKIDSAYNESQPVVTTSRGETLQPRSIDGSYLVKYVRSDVEVFIDGIFKNTPPVANEAISADVLAPQIWAEGSMLCIRMAEALPSAPVRIFTPDGRLHASFTSTPGLNRRQLSTGIYIVRVGDTARKVLIR